jgi:pimeloyl-ACP methyl ester carboxylesterase
LFLNDLVGLSTKFEAGANVPPNSDFQMWTGVSHFLHMERPAEFNGQVKAFVVSDKLL